MPCNRFLALFLTLGVLGSSPPPSLAAVSLPEDSAAAVVYAYFGVGEEETDIPAISLETFLAHLQEIQAGGYNPIALDALPGGKDQPPSLPPRSIALTFDGVTESILSGAVPLLLEKDIPFALFISPGRLDEAEKLGKGVRWEEIRSLMKKSHVTIGLTNYSAAHVVEWSEPDILADINRAKARYREELDSDPLFFSYAYGETTPALVKIVSSAGFRAAFGQNSGVVSSSSSPYALPRFTMTEDFADIDRFRMTSLALPFPVRDVEPATTELDSNPPLAGFTLAQGLEEEDMGKLSCFASGIGPLKTSRLGKNRIEVRFPKGFEESKARMNCTLPAPGLEGGEEPRWRWLGFLFSVPDALIPTTP